MTLRLITARAGAGKTQHVVTQIRFHCENKPLPRILVLLPTAAQKGAFRQRLAALARPLFGVTLSDFPSLYRDLLDVAGVMPAILREPARDLALRSVVARLARSNHLPYLGAIADKPGLLAAIARFIRDVKCNLVTPEEFASLADTPRLRDLATIYWTYQDILHQHHVVDEAEMGWLAHAALQANPALSNEYDYIAADGFDEFSPIQVSVLNALGRRVPFLDVTMTFQPRRLAHQKFVRTVELFANATCLPPVVPAPVRVPALEHLEEYIFEPDAPRASCRRCITVVATADREQEVRVIGHELKRLLAKGIPSSQIGVLFPNLAPYRELVSERFSDYDIPFQLTGIHPLSSNPAVAAFLNLLSLSSHDYPWQETLEVLRSPYFRYSGLDADMLGQIALIVRQAGVTRGKQAWLDAFVKPSPAQRDESREVRLIRKLGEAEVSTLRACIEQLMRAALPERASPRALVALIEALIGPDTRTEGWLKDFWPERYEEDASSFRMIERIRGGAADLAARDLQALAQLKRTLQDVVEAADVADETEISSKEFLANLRQALAVATLEFDPPSEGHVLVTDFAHGRGIPRDWILLGGLASSDMPAATPDDSLLDASERETLHEIRFLPASIKQQEQMSLFYEAVALARQHLYLFYPTGTRDGAVLAPSPYLAAVQTLFQDLPPSAASMDRVSEEEAASPSELALRTSLALKNPDLAARSMDRALQAASPAWKNSRRALAIEARRLSSAPFDQYNGAMRDPGVRASLAERFGSSHLWKVEDFDEWGGCGFRFFARHVLGLSELREPGQSPTPAQLDRLYHEILEKAYRRFASQSMVVTTETLADAQAIVDKIGTRLLTSAPARFGFQASAWWEQERVEIIRRLNTMIAAEAERNTAWAEEYGDIPIPVEWESAFGLRGSPPLRISLSSGPVRVAGQIDRIDKARQGMILVDYTTARLPVDIKEITEGRNLRIPLYAMTAKIKGYQVFDAYFLHVHNGETSGNLSSEDRDLVLEAARTHVERFVLSARSGAFPVRPRRVENGVCAASCQYAPLCRNNPANLRKEVAG